MNHNSNIVTEVLFINKDGIFLKNGYIYITFKDGKRELYSDIEAIDILKDYGQYVKLPSVTNLFDNINTVHKSLDEIKNDPNYKDQYDIIYNKIESKKQEKITHLQRKYKISLEPLKNIYNYNTIDINSLNQIDELLSEIKELVNADCEKYKVKYFKNPNEIFNNNINIICRNYNDYRLMDIVQNKNNNLYSIEDKKILFEELNSYPKEFLDNLETISGALTKNSLHRKKNLQSWAEFLIVIPKLMSEINSFNAVISKENKIEENNTINIRKTK